MTSGAERDVMFLAGLLLLAGGLAMIYLPAALIVPGAVLLGVAIIAECRSS